MLAKRDGGTLAIDWKGLMEAAKAKNTIIAYRRWIQRYEAFTRETGRDPLSPLTVAVWLDQLADQYKVASLSQALGAVSFYFSLHHKESPGRAPEVQLLMQAIKRKKSTAQRQAAPLTPALLSRASWGGDTKGIRDKALCLIMLGGALRVSEAIQLDYANIEFVPEGLILTIRKSKTDQTGQGRLVAIPRGNGTLCPVTALEAYLALRGRGKGPLFQSIHKNRLTGRPLPRSAVHYIVKDLADRLGLDPSRYSSHSFRAGLATAAAQEGADLDVIASQTGHRSLEVLRGYIRRANLFQRNAAGLIFKS